MSENDSFSSIISASVPINSTMQELHETLENINDNKRKNLYENLKENGNDDSNDENEQTFLQSNNSKLIVNNMKNAMYEDDFDDYEDFGNKDFTKVSKLYVRRYQELLKKNDEISSLAVDSDEINDDDEEDLISSNLCKVNSKFVSIKNKNINNQTRQISNDELRKIYQELNDIHNKLIDEYDVIQERERDLIKREKKIIVEEEKLFQLKDLNIDLIYQEIRFKYETEINNLKNELKEKVKENKRLNNSFNVLRQSNASIKKQINEKNEKILRLEEQNFSLNSRLNNFQKKLEEQSKFVIANTPIIPNNNNEIKKNRSTIKNIDQVNNEQTNNRPNPKNLNENEANKYIEVLASLVDLINKTNLKTLCTESTASVDKSFPKLFSMLVDILIASNEGQNSIWFNGFFTKSHDIFLEFIYWCILIFDTNIQFKSTYRRIGEELYKSYENHSNPNIKLNTEYSSKYQVYLRSEDIKIRMLSCLINLRTIKQVDRLKNVFEILLCDLKQDTAKELYLNYMGTKTTLKWCKITNKILLEFSINTFLQLSINWKCLDNFLETCSNEDWFSQIAILLRDTSLLCSNDTDVKTPSLDLKIIEKLSILLQKLSKKKSNRKYFEMFSLSKACNELIQKYLLESEFLIVNLKSIIKNLA